MHLVTLDSETYFDGWRIAARALALKSVPPGEVGWAVRDPTGDLPPATSSFPDAPEGSFSVPATFVDLARTIIAHRAPHRFALLYRLLWRLRSHHDLLDNTDDPDVAQAEAMADAVRRDKQRMLETLRFREIGRERTSRYVACFKPEHHILEAIAPVFARRYADMPWSILTPEISAHFDGSLISFTSGLGSAEMPSDDRLEETWRLYSANLFASGRLHHRPPVPKRSWQETPTTGAMIAEAASGPQTDPDAAMQGKTAKPLDDIETLREQAATCRACHLWKHATQTVFGEGPKHAPIMMVGEQPGDKEDLAGRPFVGPAGALLDQALEEVGIDRAKVYVTNVVKHFKWEPRGKRRIHKKPNAAEITACRPWLQSEIRVVRPRAIVCLGATAAQAVIGPKFRVSVQRGLFVASDLAEFVTATVHPSSILRAPTDEARRLERARFVEDLGHIREAIAHLL